MKVTRVLLGAALALVAALALSCSSDDGGGGGGNDGGSGGGGSNEGGNGGGGGTGGGNGGSNVLESPTQTYLVDGVEGENKRVFEGNASLTIRLREVDSGEDKDFPAGSIQSGKILFDLPDPVDGKFLSLPLADKEGCQATWSEAAKSVKAVVKDNLGSSIQGGDCSVKFYLTTRNNCHDGALIYVPESIDVTGTQTCTDSDGGVREWTFDWSLSKGWNLTFQCDNGMIQPSDGDVVEGWIHCPTN